MKSYTIMNPAKSECNITTIKDMDGILTGVKYEGNDVVVSDDHHTMDELYKHRIHLYIALLRAYDNYITPLNSRNRVRCWKSKFHNDGSSYEGWFIAGMLILPDIPFNVSVEMGKEIQISYHLPMEYWDKLNLIELEKAPVWDGHTSNDVLERLLII